MDKQEAIKVLEQAGFTLESEHEICDWFVKEYKPDKTHYYSQSQVVKVELDLNYDEDEEGNTIVDCVDWNASIKSYDFLDEDDINELTELLEEVKGECQDLESEIVREGE